MRYVGAIRLRSWSAKRSAAMGWRPARRAENAAARALAPRIKSCKIPSFQYAPGTRPGETSTSDGRMTSSSFDHFDLGRSEDLLAILFLDLTRRPDLLD